MHIGEYFERVWNLYVEGNLSFLALLIITKK